MRLLSLALDCLGTGLAARRFSFSTRHFVLLSLLLDVCDQEVARRDLVAGLVMVK